MITGTLAIALTLLSEASIDPQGMRYVADTIHANARSTGRSMSSVAQDRRLYSCWRFTTPAKELRMARRVKDAASKRRQRQAWDLAVQIQRPDYRPSGAQYYHDRRISSSRFRRLFSRNLTEVVRTNRLTFYRINERRVK